MRWGRRAAAASRVTGADSRTGVRVAPVVATRAAARSTASARRRRNGLPFASSRGERRAKDSAGSVQLQALTVRIGPLQWRIARFVWPACGQGGARRASDLGAAAVRDGGAPRLDGRRVEPGALPAGGH